MDATKGKITAAGVVRDKHGNIKQRFTLTNDTEHDSDAVKDIRVRSVEAESEEIDDGSNTSRHD